MANNNSAFYIDLVEIIKSFATEDEIVFSNEQDFQFQLALKLQAKYKDVKLELLSFDNIKQSTLNICVQNHEKKFSENHKINKGKKNKIKKEYTDIFVTDKNGDVYAIELKYKTTNRICYYETNKSKMITMAQGAYDIGAYYFIKDISRLEKINKRVSFSKNTQTIKKGFAVLLTNDKNYWDNDLSGGKAIWEDFSIAGGENKVIETNIEKKVKVNASNSEKYNSYTPIKLEGKKPYPIEWNKYDLKLVGKRGKWSPDFYFIVVEVDPL